ncbi:HNH endonuclease [Nocardioides dongxiaopingii]|uniref:HNH endonuclease family protein n=1 Tax=Nocardioides sp. S-1144 TaxID=2582905 RepID=UPI00110E43F1|nr:HNH endonuclease family protein [Nocardioides sp. S-1144]QCW51498.1 HNH endonuclease [Nocardioides sp. S-1144]
MPRRLALTGLGACAVWIALLVAPAAASAEEYSAPLDDAVASLPVATEDRTGYDRDAFEHWVDEDGDGCDTRDEVLIAEADDPVTVGSGCALSGGRWFSYYDGVSQSAAGDLDIDHMVPLAEAWDSGASDWTAAERRSYANDLGDPRSLVGVTAGENRSKSDQDVAEWTPGRERCRYLKEFVAVKIRWGLSVDGAERSAMSSLAAGCTGTVTVTLAR